MAPVLDVGHAGCRDVLKMAAESLGWEITQHNGGTAIWVDSETGAAERLSRLRQKDWLSWIPGVMEVCGKVELDKALEAQRAPFWPRSWRVPQVDVETILAEAGDATLIVKPDQGSQGSGITLAQSGKELRRAIDTLPPEGAIVQEYVARPLLIEGYKWDVRIYALMVTSPDGGHACFLAREGLVRVCVEPYELPKSGNMQRTMVHLTNYSLSKFSDKYTHGGDLTDATQGCKRNLSAVLQHLEAQSGGSFSAEATWDALAALSRQTIDAISGKVAESQASSVPGQERCFHLLGLDVLLDEAGTPWLLEVNHKPSLLIDEVHPLATGQSRAEVNKMFAAEKRESTGGSRWGRPCRCSLHPSLHEHQLCAADVASKLPAIAGALSIVRRARAKEDIESWVEGTTYRRC